MKKHVTGLVLGLTCAAAMSFGAFAADTTVEDVIAKYSEAASSATEFNCVAEMNADVAITLPDVEGAEGNFAVTGGGTMDMAVKMDPLAIHAQTDMSGDAMGQGGSISMDMYMVAKEDNSVGVYMSLTGMGEEGEWQYAEIPADQIGQVLEMAKSGNADFTNLPIEFELAEETVEVEGHECYALVAALGWEDAKALISTAMDTVKEQMGEEEAAQLEQVDEALAMGDAILSGLNVNIEIDVDTETYLPIAAHFDTDGTDWTILGALFAQSSGLTNEDGSLMNVDLNVNDLSLDYTYDFETPVEITVPEEAIAAEESGVVLDDTSALLEQAEGQLEEAMTE